MAVLSGAVKKYASRREIAKIIRVGMQNEIPRRQVSVIDDSNKEPFDGALGVFLLLLEFSPILIPSATKDSEDISHCLV